MTSFRVHMASFPSKPNHPNRFPIQRRTHDEPLCQAPLMRARANHSGCAPQCGGGCFRKRQNKVIQLMTTRLPRSRDRQMINSRTKRRRKYLASQNRKRDKWFDLLFLSASKVGKTFSELSLSILLSCL